VGLNCSFGATELRPHVQALARQADTLIMTYPNAGLPNDLGEYDEQPETTAGFIRGWAEEGLVNIVGGCCGNTPEHIAAMARQVAGLPPRVVPQPETALYLTGLEAHRFAA
jgi:5-methyltetrahydrofolate--homocysteine methyltransferase